MCRHGKRKALCKKGCRSSGRQKAPKPQPKPPSTSTPSEVIHLLGSSSDEEEVDRDPRPSVPPTRTTTAATAEEPRAAGRRTEMPRSRNPLSKVPRVEGGRSATGKACGGIKAGGPKLAVQSTTEAGASGARGFKSRGNELNGEGAAVSFTPAGATSTRVEGGGRTVISYEKLILRWEDGRTESVSFGSGVVIPIVSDDEDDITFRRIAIVRDICHVVRKARKQATNTRATGAQATEARAIDAQATDTHATDAHATDTYATETHATDVRVHATDTTAAEDGVQLRVSLLYSQDEMHHQFPSHDQVWVNHPNQSTSAMARAPDNERFYSVSSVESFPPCAVTGTVPVLFLTERAGQGSPVLPALGREGLGFRVQGSGFRV